MSRTIHHILAIAAFALLTLGVGSCVEPLDPSLRPEGPSVSFWIYVPGSMQQPVTKGLPGDVASLSPESTLKDVQVWAFRHGAGDDEAPLSTATVSNIDWKHSGTTPRSWDDCYEMSMPIPEDFLKDSDPPYRLLRPRQLALDLQNQACVANHAQRCARHGVRCNSG